MSEIPRSSRAQILETAAELFFRDGYRAVGIDTIVAASGVAKMTLYRHFPSKDELIAAYLEGVNRQFWEWFDESTAGSLTARERLLAFFHALEKLAGSPTCYGCPFLNAAVDFPDSSHPGHRIALEHKKAVRQRLRDLAGEAGAEAPELLGDQLFLLMDGAFMAVRLFGPDNPACKVAAAAEGLLGKAKT